MNKILEDIFSDNCIVADFQVFSSRAYTQFMPYQSHMLDLTSAQRLKMTEFRIKPRVCNVIKNSIKKMNKTILNLSKAPPTHPK